ncbi:TIGR04282 family arsenosugar biosynthesis glycosyltransferase [Neolewinella persica]|uniref:TIGR04282 family arsenosugar biosynthesis glycosyltransferase n=1 Tax=Neolewinella persica TaxID=70998 RepID=UPI000381F88D|nr:TIGR04282 family arsenosugar biosynthesis glycosyltransferase [Neolewinella persica]
MSENALLLFIKNPIPGKTKTRLAADVGNEMALRMYHVLCDWTREQAQGLPDADRYLYYSNEITEPDAWPAEHFHKRLQHPGDLGERMAEGIQAAFAAGHRRVVIIGSDCPGIDTDYLQAAFAALDNDDVVIGPALDGGYTLLGMRSFLPSLFTDMAWSTEEVFPTTLARAAAAGKTVHELKPLSDVDYLADWLGYGWAMPE